MMRRMRWLHGQRGTDLPPTVRALGATSFFQDVASDMVYPLLPTFLASLGGGPLVLGAMESVSDGMLALVKRQAGRASDRVARRKPFVSIGYGLSALLRPLLPLVVVAWQVAVLRIADRVAKGLRTAPRDAMIGESVEPARRAYAFAYHRGLDHLGAAAGPLIATLVLLAEPGRVRLVFLLAAIPAVVGWLIVQLRTSEQVGPERPAPTEPSTAMPVSRAGLPPRLRLALVAFFVFSLGNATDAFLLLRAHDAGIATAALPALWSAFHVAKWFASAPLGHLADRHGRHTLIIGGWVLYALVYAGFAVAGAPAVVVALFLAYALFYAATEGAERALVLDLAQRGVGAGTTLGSYHLATGLGVFGASLVFGAVWEIASAATAFALGAGLALTAALLLLASQHARSA